MLKKYKRNIVVIGASAGGLDAIIKLTEQLPADLEAAIFIVQHIPSYGISNMHSIINRKSKLTAVAAQDGAEIRAGYIYCAPPNYHLLVEDGKILLSKGPKENRFRPSVDALFRSAAYIYRERVIGIVLSGALNDGSAGVCTIKRFNGLVLTQNAAEALFDSMPLQVENYVKVDYSLPAAELGSKIAELVQETPASKYYEITPTYEEHLKLEVDIAKNKNALQMGIFEHGAFSPLTCPDCEGALIVIPEEKVLRFRCHTGHAYTADALLAGVTENIEKDLWKVMRGMEEGNFILNRIGTQLEKFGVDETAQAYYQKAKLLREKAEQIHEMIKYTEIMSKERIENK